MIEIKKAIAIREEELRFKFSRSGGPGGQNVNKVNTQVTVLFNPFESDAFSDEQKDLISKRLAKRIGRDGVLRVVSNRHRTQGANREAAVERLVVLLQQAIKPVPKRKKTAIPKQAKMRRLVEKKQRGLLKKQRAEKDFLQ